MGRRLFYACLLALLIIPATALAEAPPVGVDKDWATIYYRGSWQWGQDVFHKYKLEDCEKVYGGEKINCARTINADFSFDLDDELERTISLIYLGNTYSITMEKGGVGGEVRVTILKNNKACISIEGNKTKTVTKAIKSSRSPFVFKDCGIAFFAETETIAWETDIEMHYLGLTEAEQTATQKKYLKEQGVDLFNKLDGEYMHAGSFAKTRIIDIGRDFTKISSVSGKMDGMVYAGPVYFDEEDTTGKTRMLTITGNNKVLYTILLEKKALDIQFTGYYPSTDDGKRVDVDAFYFARLSFSDDSGNNRDILNILGSEKFVRETPKPATDEELGEIYTTVLGVPVTMEGIIEKSAAAAAVAGGAVAGGAVAGGAVAGGTVAGGMMLSSIILVPAAVVGGTTYSAYKLADTHYQTYDNGNLIINWDRELWGNEAKINMVLIKNVPGAKETSAEESKNDNDDKDDTEDNDKTQGNKPVIKTITAPDNSGISKKTNCDNDGCTLPLTPTSDEALKITFTLPKTHNCVSLDIWALTESEKKSFLEKKSELREARWFSFENPDSDRINTWLVSNNNLLSFDNLSEVKGANKPSAGKALSIADYINNVKASCSDCKFYLLMESSDNCSEPWSDSQFVELDFSAFDSMYVSEVLSKPNSNFKSIKTFEKETSDKSVVISAGDLGPLGIKLSEVDPGEDLYLSIGLPCDAINTKTAAGRTGFRDYGKTTAAAAGKIAGTTATKVGSKVGSALSTTLANVWGGITGTWDYTKEFVTSFASGFRAGWAGNDVVVSEPTIEKVDKPVDSSNITSKTEATVEKYNILNMNNMDTGKAYAVSSWLLFSKEYVVQVDTIDDGDIKNLTETIDFYACQFHDNENVTDSAKVEISLRGGEAIAVKTPKKSECNCETVLCWMACIDKYFVNAVFG